jgi:hypothetical protein
MFQLMYVSTSAWPLAHSDLNAILDISRANNRRYGVTGLLLHLDRGFLQILEGPKTAVTAVFDNIRRDHRHIGVRVLLVQDVPGRLFAGWTMGYDRWTHQTARTGGLFQITRQAIDEAIPPEKAAALAVLLRNFYRVHAGNNAA